MWFTSESNPRTSAELNSKTVTFFFCSVPFQFLFPFSFSCLREGSLLWFLFLQRSAYFSHFYLSFCNFCSGCWKFRSIVGHWKIFIPDLILSRARYFVKTEVWLSKPCWWPDLSFYIAGFSCHHVNIGDFPSLLFFCNYLQFKKKNNILLQGLVNIGLWIILLAVNLKFCQ